MPVGIFQPADDKPASEQNDLSLWRSMVREFSEELLGIAEDYRDLGSPLDYDRWDFYRELSAARQAGKLHVFCLGLGVDPLTFAVDIPECPSRARSSADSRAAQSPCRPPERQSSS